MSYNYENLVVGCGNILYKDDGFGPEVIRVIKEKNIKLPGDTVAIDGGTGAPYYLFTLPEEKWKKIIIVDIASMNQNPGTVKQLKLNQIKEEDRYMNVHGLTPTYPLHDLKDKIDIKIIACQPKEVSEDMEIGLTQEVEDSIPKTIEEIIKVLS